MNEFIKLTRRVPVLNLDGTPSVHSKRGGWVWIRPMDVSAVEESGDGHANLVLTAVVISVWEEAALVLAEIEADGRGGFRDGRIGTLE